MTPRSSPARDPQWLQDILEAVTKIERRSAAGRAAFDRNELLQDSIIRQVQIIGQAVKRLSDEFKVAHPEIPWREVAGMRDVVVHDYGEVDLDAVWSVVEKDLPPLKATVQQALRDVGQAGW